MASPSTRAKILRDLKRIQRAESVVFVHGGGPQISAWLEKAGVKSGDVIAEMGKTGAIREMLPDRRFGRVVAVRGALIEVEGLAGVAQIGGVCGIGRMAADV